MASKYEELECLYAAVGKVIYEGLTNYEKATSNTNPTQLFGKNFFFSCIIYFCVAPPRAGVDLVESHFSPSTIKLHLSSH